MTDTIEITMKEYYDLLESQEILLRLESGGVDNWSYYGESIHGTDTNEETMEEWEDRTRREIFG